MIQDMEVLRTYVPTIGAHCKLKDFKVYLKAASERLRQDVCGEELYLLAGSGDEANQKLRKHCEKIVALDAYEHGIPFMDLVQTENGFAVVSASNLLPASKDRIAALLTATAADRDEAIESLLAFLEGETRYHAAWKASPSYALLTDCFLPTLRLFRVYAACTAKNRMVYPKNRTAFAALHGKLLAVMHNEIPAVLSPAFTGFLLDQMRVGSLEYEGLLVNLRFALAYFVLDDPLQGHNYLAKVLALLKASPEDYPLWAASAQGKAVLYPPEENLDTPVYSMI